MDWLKAIAPTVATVLGGPLAGLAVEAIGEAFNWDEATKEKVDQTLKAGKMSGEDLALLKQAEVALTQRLAELDIDIERVHAGDRDSARKMQAETKSVIPGLLATLVTIGFFGILIGMMAGEAKAIENQEALLIMLGALAAAFGQVLNFFFGSSRGSEQKNATIAKLKAR